MLYPNPQIYHHLRAIFVHVPKTAGTSIERQLREKPGDVVGGHTTALAYRRSYPECFATYYKFAVVRHPRERFLSAWRYLRAARVHPALHNEVVHGHATLDEFLETLRQTPAVLAKIVHLQPQHTFICDGVGAVLVDELFRYEELAAGWARISQHLGLDGGALAKLNVSRHAPDEKYDAARLQTLVEEVYARDFELFGYAWKNGTTVRRGTRPAETASAAHP